MFVSNYFQSVGNNLWFLMKSQTFKHRKESVAYILDAKIGHYLLSVHFLLFGVHLSIHSSLLQVCALKNVIFEILLNVVYHAEL